MQPTLLIIAIKITRILLDVCCPAVLQKKKFIICLQKSSEINFVKLLLIKDSVERS